MKKSPFHLNGAAHAQINASGRGGVLLGDGAQVGEGFVPLDFFGLISVLCPAVQTAAGALAAVLAAVPRRGDRLPRDKFRLFPAADKFASLDAQEAVVFRVVVHVLHPADLRTVLSGILRFVVGRLHKAELTVAFKEKQVVHAFVASVSYDLLVARAMLLLHLPHKGNHHAEVRAVGKDLHGGDVLAVDGDLDIVTGLELSVAHMVILHAHEYRVVIRGGIAVAAAAHDAQVFFIALLAAEPFGGILPFPLDGSFPFSLSMDENDALPVVLHMPGKLFQRLQTRCLLHLLLQLFQLLLDRLAPVEGVASCPAFHLGTVNEDGFVIGFLLFLQPPDILIEQFLCCLDASSGSETGKCRVIRLGHVLQQPHEVNAVAAGFLQLATGVDAALIPIYHDLEQHPGIDLRFSPFRRIGAIQFPVIQFLKLVACQSYRGVCFHHFSVFNEKNS